MLNEHVTIIVPIHFPKMYPPSNATGLPKPKNKTQRIINIMLAKMEMNKLEFYLIRKIFLIWIFLLNHILFQINFQSSK